MCLPYLKFSDLLPETHLFFYLALQEESCNQVQGGIKFNGGHMALPLGRK